MRRVMSFFLALTLFLSLNACGQKTDTIVSNDASTWQEQYDLGIRYLSEGNYEEAVLAFTAAIQIDPKQPDAYRKAAEAYESMGDMDGAIAILAQGVDATGDDALKELLEKQNASQGEILPDFAILENGPEGILMEYSLTDPNLRDSYPINKPETGDDDLEYSWLVEFDDLNHIFQIGTTYFKFPGDAPRNVSPYEMQHDLWLMDENGGARAVAPADLRIEGNTLIWTFTIPAEYNFRLDNMGGQHPEIWP